MHPALFQLLNLSSQDPSQQVVEAQQTLSRFAKAEAKERGINSKLRLKELLTVLAEGRRIDNKVGGQVRKFLALNARILFENHSASQAEAKNAIASVAAWMAVYLGEPLPPEFLATTHDAPPEIPGQGAGLPPILYALVLKVDEEGVTVQEINTEATRAFQLTPASLPAGSPMQVQLFLLNAGNRVNLISPAIASTGHLQCRWLIIEPDYLMDVTAVAECFQRSKALPRLHLWSLFKQDQSSLAMVRGNLVNHLLDRIITHQGAGNLMDEFLASLFQLAPLELTSLLLEAESTDSERQVLQDFITHLHRAYQALLCAERKGWRDQAAHGTAIQARHCFLEPSFMAPSLGLQGRLDLLHETEAGYDIIELKSGKCPGYNAWQNHAAQATLYRLLMEARHQLLPNAAVGRTSILYAQDKDAPVRPLIRDERLETQCLASRNEMVLAELKLANARNRAEALEALLPLLQPEVDDLPDWLCAPAKSHAKAFKELTETEQGYFLHQARFVMGEKLASKLGVQSHARPMARGQSTLWNGTPQEKTSDYALLDGLELLHNNLAHEPEGEPVLVFRFKTADYPVNFRKGDILIAYPTHTEHGEEQPLLSTQVIKGSLAYLGNPWAEGLVDCGLGPEEWQGYQRMDLWVRNRQIDERFLSRFAAWAAEPDLMEKGYHQQLAGLFSLMHQVPAKRQALLGLALNEEGVKKVALNKAVAARCSPELVVLLEKALSAQTRFLVCGPPGTGKTSQCLAGLAQHFMLEEEGSESMLIAAFTNRAVDEICQNLEGRGIDFLRIGSRNSTEPRYHPYLLDNQIAGFRKRQQVKALLAEKRIVVGTVAALTGKPDIFRLKHFSQAIVDEASQLTDGQVLPLLARVDKYILIGDEKQLPCVVQQTEEEASVNEPELSEAMALTDLRMSYFERMLALTRRRGIAHLWGTLGVQFRAHQDAAAFVCDKVYGGGLKPSDLPRQHEQLAYLFKPESETWSVFGDKRLAFKSIHSLPAQTSLPKANFQEAEIAARLVVDYYLHNPAGFSPAESLGVIAPFRNQCALIRKKIEDIARQECPDGLPLLAAVTVDTVERYQGSERDCILVSLTIDQPWQMEQILSLTADGTVCRKLNVALSRARERTLLLGNAGVLATHPIYRELLEYLGNEPPYTQESTLRHSQQLEEKHGVQRTISKSYL